MKIISIRQPGYLPYLGFFKKIESVDVIVYLDDVLYSRGDWDNRNKIRTYENSMWLTVPILNNSKKLLNEIEIDYSQDWVKKHISAIKYNYESTKFFDMYWNEIKNILEKKYINLIDLNINLINYFISILDIHTKRIFSSELKIKSHGSQRILEICKNLNATIYLSGEVGRDYLDTNLFENNKINVVFEKFEHPIYTQKYTEFIPNMSIIDLIFNEGENSKHIIKNCKNF